MSTLLLCCDLTQAPEVECHWENSPLLPLCNTVSWRTVPLGCCWYYFLSWWRKSLNIMWFIILSHYAPIRGPPTIPAAQKSVRVLMKQRIFLTDSLTSDKLRGLSNRHCVERWTRPSHNRSCPRELPVRGRCKEMFWDNPGVKAGTTEFISVLMTPKIL